MNMINHEIHKIKTRAIQMGIKNQKWVNCWVDTYCSLSKLEKDRFWELYETRFQLDVIFDQIKHENLR